MISMTGILAAILINGSECRAVENKRDAMKLTGKAVLITGAARRIGRTLAEALAAAGCRLALHCNSSVAEAENFARSLRRRGVRVCVINRNLLEPRACEAVIVQAQAALGRLDILINNAAVFGKKPLATSSEEDIRQTLSLNLVAPVLLTGAFARIARSGRIINILDRRIAANEKGMAAYLLSKKALAVFTGLAALELAPGIAVNAVAPGPVLPPPFRTVRDKAGIIPLGKRPSPADIAAAVVFLLQAEAITGEIIFVDGGQHLLGGDF